MDWTWYLFRFDGRINRAKLWLAGLIIVCWMIFLGALVLGIGNLSGITSLKSFGFGVDDIFGIVDPASFRSLSSADLFSLCFKAIGVPLFVWVYVATSVKRLHDRDKSAWWIIPFFVIPGLYTQFADRLGDSWVVFPLALIAFILCIWGFIEMYCLKGSRKTNRFGPNPLAPRDTRPRWEQHSELQIVPHKAGPPPVWHVKRGHE
jgi:uncharacterized membrane protein YhaH (DUF805 family)